MSMIKQNLESILNNYNLTTKKVATAYSDRVHEKFVKFILDNNFSTVEDAGIYLYNICKILTKALEKAEEAFQYSDDCGIAFMEEEYCPETGVFCCGMPCEDDCEEAERILKKLLDD